MTKKNPFAFAKPITIDNLSELFAHHRANLGGWTMELDDNPPADTPPADNPPTTTPPWGEDFSAEKAWNLIQNLRSDKEKLSAREFLTDDQKTKLAEYDRLVEASKTELEKAQEAAGKVPTLEAQNLRLQVALEKGLVGDRADLVARLQGNTKEELAADADKLLALLGPAAPGSKTPPPIPGLAGGGQVPPTDGPITDPSVLSQMTPEQIVEAKNAGRLDRLLGRTQ